MAMVACRPMQRQRLTEPDGRRRLALAEGRRCHRGHHDVAGPWPVGEGLDRVEADLGHVRAVGLEQPGPDPHLRGDVGDRAERGPARDLDGRRDGHGNGSCQTLAVARGK